MSNVNPQKELLMTKVLGAAIAAVFLAGPAMAQRVTTGVPSSPQAGMICDKVQISPPYIDEIGNVFPTLGMMKPVDPLVADIIRSHIDAGTAMIYRTEGHITCGHAELGLPLIVAVE